MQVSLKKISGFRPESVRETPKSVDLKLGQFQTETGETKIFELEHWPIMLFLKGLGFEKVAFHTSDSEPIENWAMRLAAYQLSYLFDPENFRIEDCEWNEIEDGSAKPLVECHLARTRSPIDEFKSLSTVPPLEAPLGVDPDSVRKFIDEVDNQSAPETLLRIQSIITEYEKDSKETDPHIWGALLADVVTISLESRLLEKATEIAEKHLKAFTTVWSDVERTIRLFAAYDPKGTELFSWSRIFSTLETAALIRFFESQLSSKAGPQMIKLMSYRAQNQSEEMIEICFDEKPANQKILLQWLTPHWRQKHYPKVWAIVKKILKDTKDEDLLRLWITTLLRSSVSSALRDLLEFFPKPSFWKIKKPNFALQRCILQILADHPSSEVFQFIKSVRNRVTEKLVNVVEKILNAHGVK